MNQVKQTILQLIDMKFAHFSPIHVGQIIFDPRTLIQLFSNISFASKFLFAKKYRRFLCRRPVNKFTDLVANSY